jgi:AsmA protein
MKPWKLLAIAAAAAVLFGAAALPWLIPEALLRAAIADRVEAAIGVRPSLIGPVGFSLFPTPRVTALDVRIDGAPDEAPLLTAARVDGELRPQNLLVGQIETGTVTISGGRFNHVLATGNSRSWISLLAGREGAPSTALGRVRILASALSYGSGSDPGARDLRIDDLVVSWPRKSAAATIVGDVGVRGEQLGLEIEAATPSHLLAGGASPLSIAIKSAKLDLSLTGDMSAAGGPRVEATLTVATTSLREALRWAGMNILSGETLAAGRLQAEAVLTLSGFSFTQATLELDGNQAEGALEVNLSGDRVSMTGTLAADSVDLSRYASDATLVQSGSGTWREDRIDPQTFDRMNLDVRFSANEITFGRAKVGRSAIAAAIRDGELEVTLGEAILYGGVFSGQMKLSKSSQDALKLAASVSYRDIDLSGVLEGFFATTRWDGTGSGTAEVHGSGSTVKEIVASLSGTASVSAVDGAVNGIDIEDTLRRIQRRPLSTRLSVDGGRTPFDVATAGFELANGIARSTDISLKNDRLHILLGGEAVLPQQKLRLSGQAALLQQSANSADAPVTSFLLPFTIEGDFDRPRIEADPRALMRQSGAAAPLMPGLAPSTEPRP